LTRLGALPIFVYISRVFPAEFYRDYIDDYLEEGKIQPIIPPRKGARIKKHGNGKGKPWPRDKNIRDIRKRGRRRWKEKTTITDAAKLKPRCTDGKSFTEIN